MSFTRSLLRRAARLLLLSSLAAALPAQAQSFLQPKVIPTGNWPDAVYTADINSDGAPDLIYIDHGATPDASTTHVLLNDGHAAFTPSATLATRGAMLSVADIDQDGHPDITWLQSSSNSTGTIVSAIVARGNGDGTFQTPVPYCSLLLPPGPYNFTSLVAGHILHSGQILDLAFVNTATPQLILMSSGYALTTGSGGFYPISGQPGPLALADLNSDGYQDVILQQGTTSAAVYLSQPFPTAPRPYASLNPLAPFSPAAGIHSLLVQDVNFDGRPDLIAEGANGRIDVFPGLGDGTFSATSIGGTGTLDGRTGNGGHLIAVADLNHDNLLDALTITPAGVSTLLGQGTAYLGLKGIFNAGPTGQSGHPSYITADFNRDGILDLAVDSPEGIAILFGTPDGAFQTSRAFPAGAPALSSATGIFTASGHPDVAVSTAATQAQLLRGQGDGTLIADPAPTTSLPGPPGLWSTILAADLTHDGKLDLLLTADGPAAAIPHDSIGAVLQAGDGTGTFAAPQPLVPSEVNRCPTGPGFFFGTSALGENRLSPAIVNRDFSGAHYRFNGASNFPTGGSNNPEVNQSNVCGPFPHNLAILADFRNPGGADAIVQADGHLYLLPLVAGGVLNNIPLGDLSVDGSLTTPGQLTAPKLFPLYGGYVGTSDGGLGFPAVLGSLTTADLDRDGNIDLIATYNNFAADPRAPNPSTNPSYVYIWFGDGTGHFPTSAAHPVNPVRFTPSRNFYKAAVADLNGDGIPDLILTDGYLISVQPGKGDGSFGPETHYLAGQGINSLSTADLRNIGQTDLVIANGGAYLADPAANRDLPATNPDVNTGGVTVLLNSPSVQPVLLTLTGVVVATLEPSAYSNLFTVTARLNRVTGNPVPTGTITYSVDGVFVERVSLMGPYDVGILYPSPNTLPIGTHTLTAVYSGDANYAPATFTGTHVVGPAASPGSLTASPEPSAFGSAFTITATGFGAGTYQFSIDGVSIGSVTSSTSSASIAGPTNLSAGPHALSVAWLATGHALATVVTGTHAVSAITRAPTSLALVLCVDDPGSLFPCATPLAASPLKSPVTMYYGQILDGAATESSTTLTGTIDFLDNTRAFCTINANLAAGMSTCPPTAGLLHAGSRTVTAAYSGDTLNQPSTSNAIAVQVFPAPTNAIVTTSGSPALVATPVTFTAGVTSLYAAPVGTASFFDGSNLLGSVTLDAAGNASLTTASLATGAHTITVSYSGTPDFVPFTPVTFQQVIVAPAVTPSPTTVTLVATGPTTIFFNQPAFSRYNVSVVDRANHPPTGTITVQDNGFDVAICTGIPTGSTCPYAAGGNLSVGTHSIVVLYNGDSFNAPAASAPVVFTVLAATPVITLTSSANPATVATPVTFTATFTGILGTGFSGSLDFLDGPTLLSTLPISSAGVATFTTSTLTLGTHSITARYNGSTNFLAAASPVLNQVIADVVPTAFTLTVAPNPITLPVGRTGILRVTVTTPAGFASPIALSCTGLPTQAGCTFFQPVLPAAGGSTTLQLSIAAPHNCGDPTHPYFISAARPLLPRTPRNSAFLLPAGLLLTFSLARARRRLRALLVSLALVSLSALLLTSLSGCGACTDLGTRPGRYTLTVTATPQGSNLGSAPASATQPVNLTINLP